MNPGWIFDAVRLETLTRISSEPSAMINTAYRIINLAFLLTSLSSWMCSWFQLWPSCTLYTPSQQYVVTKTRNHPKPPKTTQNDPNPPKTTNKTSQNHPKPATKPTKPTKTTQNQLQYTLIRPICVDGSLWCCVTITLTIMHGIFSSLPCSSH